MKLPKLMSAWVTSDKQAHPTREDALHHEVGAELKRRLLNIMEDRRNATIGGHYFLMPDEVVACVLEHYHIEPKVIEN